MRTLQCAETLILYCFCPWKHKETTSKVGCFNKIKRISITAHISPFCQDSWKLVTCSWHQNTKPRILQFTNLKCCIKGRELFKIPFSWCIISYFFIIKTFCSSLNAWIGNFFDFTNRLFHNFSMFTLNLWLAVIFVRVFETN